MKSPKLIHRVLANIFDLFVIVALVLIALIPSIVTFINLLVTSNLGNQIALYIASFFSGALSLLFIVVYAIVVPVHMNGQTLGKRYFNIAVIKNNGTAIDMKTMLVRELTRFFVFLTTFGMSLFIDLIALASSAGKLSFYDTISSTSVVDVFVE